MTQLIIYIHFILNYSLIRKEKHEPHFEIQLCLNLYFIFESLLNGQKETERKKNKLVNPEDRIKKICDSCEGISDSS